MVVEKAEVRMSAYFFSTLTFWLSQERPSKMPVHVFVSITRPVDVYRWVFMMPTLSAGGATGLDLPYVVLSNSVEVEGLSYVVGSHCWRVSCERFAIFVFWTNRTWNCVLTTVNILLVGEDEKDHIAHFAILDDAAEFGFGFFHASAVA
jgi:hypothetical protein